MLRTLVVQLSAGHTMLRRFRADRCLGGKEYAKVDESRDLTNFVVSAELANDSAFEALSSKCLSRPNYERIYLLTRKVSHVFATPVCPVLNDFNCFPKVPLV